MARALISVTDKSGVVDFAQRLVSLGFDILSTGGTAKALREAGIAVTDVADITGFPEMLDGRVKTLHPMVHGGILGDRRLESHLTQMDQAGIVGIDLVCVNLYAFEKTVTGDHDLDEAIESIDIGGPAMVRAAAKNFHNVTIVVDPADYDRVGDALSAGSINALRMELSAAAFRHTAYYDSVIARYLSEAAGVDPLSGTVTMGVRKQLAMRYGENPHQVAGLYVDPLAKNGIAQAEQLWGKELSYNNLLDADGAWELVMDLVPNSCAIIKHGNPCGAAEMGSMAESYSAAKSSDPISAFGGIAAFHGVIDLAAAEAMTQPNNFLEVVIGLGFTNEAIEVFKNRKGWGQNVRLLVASASPTESYLTVRSIRGGVLIQGSDEDPGHEWQVVTKRQPSDNELAAMKLAWRMIPHVKSNAIVLTDDRQLLGVGAGQMNRVQSVRLALEQAGETAPRCALGSDAFFPFPDSIETAAAAGVKAVIQPGGSVKDDEVIARADELGITMVLTGTRHFRH
ncbi:bifunctional phosphoribosylaminoimidazolecarboxamide formyltransferase/IMP cyclohydrolase [Armatimonadetes bacterium Uphvl-Ar1]|nr:bifunctional phosphoribosylaminoimidazolecarboxamide formyltransferase/IMP cyclohydrolase [Armatimonadetes bacterium Uphvl-Ar1]